MDTKTIWSAALGELEVNLSKASFTTWFRGTDLLDLNEDNQTATIKVPSIFAKEWFENKYNIEIVKTLKKLTDNKITTVVYQIGGSNTIATKPSAQSQAKTKTKDKPAYQQTQELSFSSHNQTVGLKLKPDYTFDNFIVGPNNRLAYAASQAVSKNPGKRHNPLVIYGGVGLGKTHLVQAIGNALKQEQPDLTILYISCEDFANDYVQSIQSKKIDSFKKRYRSVDVFLVDDIQFLSRKESTQEEFFHTFNTLQQNDRQIVMTSDRIPTAIHDLEDRLASRFSQGLVADVQPPNLETRLAILNEKANILQVTIPPEVIDLIATNIQSNIRELEGALNRVIAFANLQGQPATMDSARQALKEFVGSTSKKINPDRLIETISKIFAIDREDLLGPRRTRDLIHPRQIIMYLLKNELAMSYPKIGQAMNGKDHTTIMHGVRQVEKELSKNNELRDELSAIKRVLYSD